MTATVTAPKVNREGVVSRDGEIIGHVKKEMRQGIFATLLGASYSGTGTPFWIPFAADGTQLSDGYETRKRAVERIDKHSRPLTIDRFKTERYTFGGTPFVSAWVSYQGHSFGVSRYANEDAWIVDCYFTPDSMMPVWSNGSGTRVTLAHTLKPEMAEKATEAAIAAGVWPIPEEFPEDADADKTFTEDDEGNWREVKDAPVYGSAKPQSA